MSLTWDFAFVVLALHVGCVHFASHGFHVEILQVEYSLRGFPAWILVIFSSKTRVKTAPSVVQMQAIKMIMSKCKKVRYHSKISWQSQLDPQNSILVSWHSSFKIWELRIKSHGLRIEKWWSRAWISNSSLERGTITSCLSTSNLSRLSTLHYSVLFLQETNNYIEYLARTETHTTSLLINLCAIPPSCISAQSGCIALAMQFTEPQTKSKHFKGGNLNSEYILCLCQQYEIMHSEALSYER